MTGVFTPARLDTLDTSTSELVAKSIVPPNRAQSTLSCAYPPAPSADNNSAM